MNSLTNEQVARVFAMYLNGKNAIGHRPQKMLDARGNKVIVTLYALSSDRAFLRDCKLLLTPLSAISDEDATKVGFFYFGTTLPRLLDYAGRQLIVTLYGVKIDNHEGVKSRKFESPEKLTLIDQLLRELGYATPLFIAPNHPDNGKTAIELGLAIDKTKNL